MDPVTGAVVIAGLKFAGKPTVAVIGRLVERLLGPIADTGGDALDEWVRRRHERAEAVFTDSAKMLRTAQLEPQPVPGRILFPIIQNASLEEDDDLRAKWSVLLANAASPGTENEILPGYAEILRQLIPVQAKMLDHMYQQTFEMSRDVFEPGEPVWSAVERDDLMNRFGLSPEKYILLASDFYRMNLIVVGPSSAELVGLTPANFGTTESSFGTIRPTAFCLAFMRACTPPGAHSGSAKKG